ncbi:hypothetical protein WN51_06464 [Melipona quadrifasciata]|uniref:Uncharacterized protein n=1 Tax=Melipona quadrifasciata TaxID=166423 RepID=A0A0M9A9N4_9HYME|nr:hypothetical protein WN51_06464 [Melipona quadrifasciata]
MFANQGAKTAENERLIVRVRRRKFAEGEFRLGSCASSRLLRDTRKRSQQLDLLNSRV